MSATLSLANCATPEVDKERGHRRRVFALSLVVVLLLVAIAVYGFDYYRLGAADRPFSPKYELLKPSGRIGLKLGILGLGMFVVIFLYPLRKRIKWMLKIGSSRHWLDFHIVLGLSAPVVIAFHASFKFRGVAGMAFWIMFAVALSGIIGRYIYAQIPRSLSSAEISMKELEGMEQEMTHDLAAQKLARPADLAALFRVPSAERVRKMPLYRVFFLIFALDLIRPFRVARLRTHVLGWGRAIWLFGGLFRSSNAELEQLVQTARRKSSLSKRIAFLGRTQQVFHLWHVIHRPFSYSFAVLACIHIVVVILLGYF